MVGQSSWNSDCGTVIVEHSVRVTVERQWLNIDSRTVMVEQSWWNSNSGTVTVEQ